MMKSRTFIRYGLAALLAGPALSLSAADDELVVVDQDTLTAYWRADARHAQSLILSGDGPEIYGCMAMPFVIEIDGRLSPGRTPLLIKTGQSAAGGQVDMEGLHALAMGALPPFHQTWDQPPDSAIYSSRSMVFGDARIRSRLGEEKWAALHDALERACRIDGLAAWLERNDEKTVEQRLPANPDEFMRQTN